MHKYITKTVFAISMGLLAISTFNACKKKMVYPNCRTDGDCRVDAEGNEVNNVCYMGKCEECIEDADCPGLKMCVENRCKPICSTDDDCPVMSHCENNMCVDDCMSDDECLMDLVCVEGRCVEEKKEAVKLIPEECQGLTRVHFEFDRYNLQKKYYDEVDQVATCLNNNPDYTLIIEGHTDERGTTEYNMALGEKRAKAVMNYLVKRKGIASDRIKTVSYGEQKPLIDESNKNAWSQNRRAKFVVETN